MSWEMTKSFFRSSPSELTEACLVPHTVASRRIQSMHSRTPHWEDFCRGWGGQKTQYRGLWGCCLGGTPASFAVPCLILTPTHQPLGVLRPRFGCTPHPGESLSSQSTHVCNPSALGQILRDLQGEPLAPIQAQVLV